MSQAIRNLLKQTLRITITDGRVFIGTFAGTDQQLNILLMNTEEYHLGLGSVSNGRFVGQVMIPWRLVVQAEASGHADEEHCNPHGESVAALYI